MAVYKGDCLGQLVVVFDYVGEIAIGFPAFVPRCVKRCFPVVGDINRMFPARV